MVGAEGMEEGVSIGEVPSGSLRFFFCEEEEFKGQQSEAGPGDGVHSPCASDRLLLRPNAKYRTAKKRKSAPFDPLITTSRTPGNAPGNNVNPSLNMPPSNTLILPLGGGCHSGFIIKSLR